MNCRPKILYLVHRQPYPPNRGDRIRSYNLLKFLAARADVSLAFLSESPADSGTMGVLHGLCERVAAVAWEKHTRWIRAAHSFASGRTATEGLFRSRRLKQIIQGWAEKTEFDLVVVFCSSMVQYLDVPGLAGVPVVVDLVDVDSQKWFDYAEHSSGLVQCVLRAEGNRLRKLEASIPDRAEAVTVVSPQEAALFRSFSPSERVYPILNGVDLEYFHPEAESSTPSPETCVFVGALDYRANVDGVTWFCERIWPGVRRRRPQAAFRLVGSRPGASARRLARLPGVELVGEVPDVRPYLRDAAVAVVPLRVARGLQNKVLEAMAMGKAVVASPQALEGIGATPGVHVCQAATPEEWGRSISDLLTDPDRCARLGRAARAFVEEQYQWKTQLATLADLPGLSECLQQARAATSEPIAAKT